MITATATQRHLYLGLDTAGEHLALALWAADTGTLARTCEVVGRDHARRLPGSLTQLFQEAGAAPRELAGVTVGLGPGSYTGLRVGVATAQGLARGLGATLRGEPSLGAMAAGLLSPEQPTGLFALDARRGNVYAGVYHDTPEGPKLQGEIVKAPREALRAAYPLPYFEDLPPDASYLARRGVLGSTALTPFYL